MKDSQKRWKPDTTNSVIAMLMGLDEPLPQPPIHESRRGLSERYLRNAASVGLRSGSLVSISRSCSSNNELVARMQASSSENDDVSDRLVNSRTWSASKDKVNSKTTSPGSSSLLRASNGSGKSIGKKDEHRSKHVLRCQQKLEHDSLYLSELGIDSKRKSFNSQLEIIDNTRSFSTSRVVYGPKDVQSHAISGYREQWKRLKTGYGNLGRPQRWKIAKKVQEFGDTGLCNPTSLIYRSSDSNRPPVLSNSGVVDDESLKSLPVSEVEAVKDILSTGWNLTQYEHNAIENTSEKQTASKILESKSGKCNKQSVSSDSKASELSSCSRSCFDSTSNDPEAYVLGIHDEMDKNDNCNDYEPSATKEVSSRTHGDPVDSEEGGQPSSIDEVFGGEASLDENIDEESVYSNSSTIVPQDSVETLKRTNQHSPSSVLESFDTNKVPFGCLDSTGLRLQLESLMFESEETNSEGSVMVVSGDEDALEEFDDHSRDSRNIKRWLGDGECRNFSYVVDVIDEAVFCGTNSHMDFNKWYSLECPINPSVFDALEKKYGKQTSWPKSERQILFDRINSGLVEIFNPIINFPAATTSVRRRFSSSFRLDEVIEELWLKLDSQEKDKSKELSKKALDSWLELEEGIDIICTELETSLFDELVTEFASLWD